MQVYNFLDSNWPYIISTTINTCYQVYIYVYSITVGIYNIVYIYSYRT